MTGSYAVNNLTISLVCNRNTSRKQVLATPTATEQNVVPEQYSLLWSKQVTACQRSEINENSGSARQCMQFNASTLNPQSFDE